MITVIFFILIFIAIFFVIWLSIQSPSEKGRLGEAHVINLLSSLPKNEYIVLSDFMFRDWGRSTQIDHIIISIYGIFVIETKNYKGSITGRATDQYWIQNIYGKKFQFYNPIHQNRSHIKFLLGRFPVLNDFRIPVYSVIVFMKTANLFLARDIKGVVSESDLLSYITSFDKRLVTGSQCNAIAQLFLNANITDENERREHYKYVETIMMQQQDERMRL